MMPACGWSLNAASIALSVSRIRWCSCITHERSSGVLSRQGEILLGRTWPRRWLPTLRRRRRNSTIPRTGGWCATGERDGEVAGEAGDRLPHWDLHFENVLAAEREPWLAIDPKPLLGDPAFDVLPALGSRWNEAMATGDPARAMRRRYDLMVDELALDRERALAGNG